MRKFMVLITVLVAALVVAEDEIVIKDVNPNTVPEYGIIRFLVSNGIMTLENGKFGGSEVVSRYELARVLYRLIKYLMGRSPEEVSSGGMRPLDEIHTILGYNPEKKDFERIAVMEDRLKRLEVGYLSMSSEIDDLRDELGETKGHLESLKTSFDEKVENLKGELKKLGDDLSELKRSIEELGEKVESSAEKMTRIEVEMSRIGEKMGALERGYAKLTEDVGKVGEHLETLEASLSSCGSELENLSERVLGKFEDLGGKLGELGKRLGRVEKLSKERSEDIENLKLEISRMKRNFDDLSSRLSELEGEMIYGRMVVEYPFTAGVIASPSTALVEGVASKLEIEMETRLEEIESELASEIRKMVVDEVSKAVSEELSKAGVKPEDLGRVKEEAEKSVRESLEKEFVRKDDLDMAISDLEKRIMRWILWITVIVGVMITLLLMV